jgi:hypothetical protein
MKVPNNAMKKKLDETVAAAKDLELCQKRLCKAQLEASNKIQADTPLSIENGNYFYDPIVDENVQYGL